MQTAPFGNVAENAIDVTTLTRYGGIFETNR
jgi:hypothetical protein